MSGAVDADYLWNEPTVHSSQLGVSWPTALSQLGANARRAGLLYVHFGPWPPWLWVLAQGAAVQAATINFYFIGDPLPLDLAAECPMNCHWLPLNSHGLLDRIELLLNVSRSNVSGIVDANGAPLGGYYGTRKLCDLKPFWPALFPELTSRHEWIGYADDDIVFGDLASEVAHLGKEDELLVPVAFYPEPLANGNFLLMRANLKMVHAYRRSAWRQVLRSPFYMRFDEWGGELDHYDANASSSGRRVASEGGFDHDGEGSATMRAVYSDMVLSGELCARPTRRLLVQDTIVQLGRHFPSLNTFGGQTELRWMRDGRLIAERIGPCVCPRNVVAQFGLSMCSQCLRNPGANLKQVTTHRRLEVLGFHFLYWKKNWRMREHALRRKNNGTRPNTSAVPPYPVPAPCPASQGWTLREHTGFVCDADSHRLRPLFAKSRTKSRGKAIR